MNLVFAKSGCCSHHGGVSGCDTSNGRQVCNDGTYSPSCTCESVTPKVQDYNSTSGTDSNNFWGWVIGLGIAGVVTYAIFKNKK